MTRTMMIRCDLDSEWKFEENARMLLQDLRESSRMRQWADCKNPEERAQYLYETPFRAYVGWDYLEKRGCVSIVVEDAVHILDKVAECIRPYPWLHIIADDELKEVM